MLKPGVPTQAVAEYHGTSARMIEANYAKFVPSDRARYAALSDAPIEVKTGERSMLRFRLPRSSFQ